MSNPSSVYSDFCQAWVSRFPHSDLPAAWEEDVRANLKKHKSKVAVLKEELEKEEMYVEYLDKLLGDIEAHRKLNPLSGGDSENGDNSVEALNSENKRRSASSDIVPENGEDATPPTSAIVDVDQLSPGDLARDRGQLRLDLGLDEGGPCQQTEFVTVINVPAAAAKGAGGLDRPTSEPAAPLSSFKKVPPRPPPKRTVSRDSLNSVSSPTTPSSAHLLLLEEDDDLENPRESLLSPSSSLKRQTSTDPASTVSRDSSEEQDEEDFEFNRGRPDGEDQHNKPPLQKRRPQLQQHPKVNKIKELMANWEGSGGGAGGTGDSRPRSLQTTPMPMDRVRARASSLKTSSSSSSSDRGRMGSPSGKSHESSDGENNNWPGSSSAVLEQQQHPRAQKTQSQGGSPGGSQRRRRMLPSTNPAETRLDRLVRRPSGERSSPVMGRHSEALPVPPPPPPLPNPRPVKKPRAKPRSHVGEKELTEEPLYDTVANEEPEDEYDNHLLYGTNSTTKSGGSSSADLGFDEPKHHHHNSLAKSAQSGLSGSGTLSSSETDKSASLKRGISLNPEGEEEEECNYVNIQYFLQGKQEGKQSTSSSSNMLDTIQSDDELDKEEDLSSSAEVFNEESESEASSSASSEADRVLMYKSILNSIVDSEAAYLECLSVVLQYMKAMKVTLTTSQPVIPREEFDAIFYKIPELHDLHFTFHESLKKQVGDCPIGPVGHTFKMLASRTKIYASFLANYRKALDALHRSSDAYPQFADLTRSIKLRSVKGQQQPGQSMSLEDLLHKPVARIQKLSLGLQDLLRYAAAADRAPIGDALRQMRDFVGEYNSHHDAANSCELFPQPPPLPPGHPAGMNQASDLATQQLVQAQQQQRRHLVKNSFIVELHEGARKLRHLFLFNDVLVCAKYKASSKRTEKFTFLLKWHIPLYNALIVEEPSSEPKESNPANLVTLKTQTTALRDQIYRLEREEEFKSGGGRRASGKSIPSTGDSRNLSHSKATEKPRKKLAEVEAQLLLASPGLVFQVSHKAGNKSFTFFLSSEYERAQWVETLQALQSALPPLHKIPGQQTPSAPMSTDELQSWITSCRKFLKTNMGSFLMRSQRDEPLLVGDLHFSVYGLQGLTRPSDLFVVIETDSYGHYFRKAKTRLSGGSTSLEPRWDEDFIVELEGSENLRILVYEQQPGSGNVLRGRATLELSRNWLTSRMVEQRISMNDVVLTCGMRFAAFEETVRRVPAVKSTAGLFGTDISVSAKREKRAVPFIVTSCVREVERRGISEVGIYRVSGSAVDVAKLKKAYESNPYEAEQMLKECDIHSVAGTLKLYLRDLPESIFTTHIYQEMFKVYQSGGPDTAKAYLALFSKIPQSPNQACIVFLIEHMVRVSQHERQNKMSPHNLATVFGPTMLHGQDGLSGKRAGASKDSNQLATGTVDVMAQAGILLFFISRRARGEPIQIVERQV